MMLPAGQAHVRSFRVVPDVPPALRPLVELAHNLWWTWHPEAVELFERLDREAWEHSEHNPVRLLGMIRQETLDRVAKDQSFLHALGNVYARFQNHLTRASWFQQKHAHALGEGARAAVEKSPAPEEERPLRIAYFCAEFGFTECLQIYSGGLGVLAGDHLKSASELGLPLCGVGLLYRNGYFHQYLNADGWQQERYPDLDFPNQPIRRLIDPATGEQYRVQVELPGRSVTIGVWVCNVGRVPVYLLDTNLSENLREDRDITKNLYGGDIETRIKQEIVLGIGGVRALEKVGERVTFFHINEGHAAFLALERIANLRERHGVSFDEALPAASAAHLFTTHTPVPAGIDRFSPELMQRYFEPILGRLGLDLGGFLALGRNDVFDPKEFFSMAVLAIRTTSACNGVSRLHGEVSRAMWRSIWPGVPEGEVPIGHVTNGVHPRSWISPPLMQLYDRYLGPEWQHDPTDFKIWNLVADIPDVELWQIRRRQREKLVTWCRRKLRSQLEDRGVSRELVERAVGALDPDVLTIGFARRFATYKRATLFLQDLERLRAILLSEDRPVQIIVAGKAHPADGPGKELIRTINTMSGDARFRHRIVMLEDYDIDVARRLVQGCDIWLNNPRRGMEASGTSGMKAAMNGVMNVSILDGWWDEAWNADVGWAIGKGETYDNTDEQDRVEGRALYELIERQIVPEFYERDESGLPRRWIARMKACIRQLTPMYSTNRMVAEYAEKHYFPGHRSARGLLARGLAESRESAAHLRRFHECWHEVAVRKLEADVGLAIPVRSTTRVRAVVQLGRLRPDEVRVQLYHGEVTSLGDMVQTACTEMRHNPDLSADREGSYVFEADYTANGSGRRGFTVRVLPWDPRFTKPMMPGLLTWLREEDSAFGGLRPQAEAARPTAEGSHAATH